MKKRILFGLIVSLLVLAAALSAACSGSTSTTPGMKHFSGEGISFDYPEEWYKVGFDWEAGYEWGICFSGGTGDEPGVFVLRYALGDKTLEQFANESAEIGYGPDFTISTPVETTISSQPAYRYHYSGTKYGVPVEGDTVIVRGQSSLVD